MKWNKKEGKEEEEEMKAENEHKGQYIMKRRYLLLHILYFKVKEFSIPQYSRASV